MLNGKICVFFQKKSVCYFAGCVKCIKKVILMEYSTHRDTVSIKLGGRVQHGPKMNLLNFGHYLNHRADTQFIFHIR